jgi:hypothetical protein
VQTSAGHHLAPQSDEIRISIVLIPNGRVEMHHDRTATHAACKKSYVAVAKKARTAAAFLLKFPPSRVGTIRRRNSEKTGKD